MKKFSDHVELTKVEATQATEKPPTQYVLGISLAGVIVAFGVVAMYW